VDYDDYQDAPENDVVPCPACGRPVYDDVDQCPHCGEWIMPLAHHARMPAWARWTAAVVAVAFLLWILRGMLRSLF
jgi:hypothetical protein